MKNFEMRCSVDGTTALQPKFDAGNVIAFPGRPASLVLDDASNKRNGSSKAPCATCGRILNSEMGWSLRYGTARGRSFDRVKPWQAAFVGIVFSAVSFASLLTAL